MYLKTCVTYSFSRFIYKSVLTCWHEERVEHADSLRQHGDLQTQNILEVLHELGQRHLFAVLVVERESVPKGPLVPVVLLARRLDGLGKGEERQCQIGESVLVGFRVFVALHQFVELEADEASDQRSRGGDGRDDAAGDQLGLEAVRHSDAVIVGAEVGRGDDEVHVEVGVVVLLELGRTNNGRLGKGLRRRELLCKFGQTILQTNLK
jgi:hypothetical protein